MKSPTRDVLIGLTAIGGLLVLAWMLMRFGELAGVGVEYRRITLRVDSARGVSPVAPVTYRGVRIGDVTGIRLADDSSGDAIVDLRYRADANVPTAFDIFLDASFVGEAKLDIEPRETWDGTYAEGTGEEYAVAVRSLTSALTSQLSDRFGRLEQTADRVDELAETYTDVGRRLSTLIESDEAGSIDLAATLERIDRVLADAESWLDDGALLADVRGAIERFEASADAIGDETRALRERAEITLDSADAALLSLDEAGAEVTQITARINRGEGTLGQLATNPDLYRTAEALVEELLTLIRDARLLVEKFRDEGVPINL
ncbi:MAG: MlaD family protein [Planctomycetota bacterium]